MNPQYYWPFPNSHTSASLTENLIAMHRTINEFGNIPLKSDKLELDNSPETDPSGRAFSEPGSKGDQGKNLPWLFQTGFANALHEVSRVCTLGAQKYTPNGWKTVDNGQERYMEAFARHTSDLARGATFDDGPSGLGVDIYHKASMIWNLLASLELDIKASK